MARQSDIIPARPRTERKCICGLPYGATGVAKAKSRLARHSSTAWSVAVNSCAVISGPPTRRRARHGRWRKNCSSTPAVAAATASRFARRGSSSSFAAFRNSISGAASALSAAPAPPPARMARCHAVMLRPRRGRSRRGWPTPAWHNAEWNAGFAANIATRSRSASARASAGRRWRKSTLRPARAAAPAWRPARWRRSASPELPAVPQAPSARDTVSGGPETDFALADPPPLAT